MSKVTCSRPSVFKDDEVDKCGNPAIYSSYPLKPTIVEVAEACAKAKGIPLPSHKTKLEYCKFIWDHTPHSRSYSSSSQSQPQFQQSQQSPPKQEQESQDQEEFKSLLKSALTGPGSKKPDDEKDSDDEEDIYGLEDIYEDDKDSDDEEKQSDYEDYEEDSDDQEEDQPTEYKIQVPTPAQHFFPVDDVDEFLKTVVDCFTYQDPKQNVLYGLMEQIGEGSGGSIREVCYNSKCPYVAKMIQLDETDLRYTPKKLFVLEARITKNAGEKGYGPALIGAYMCPNFGIMILPRLDGDLLHKESNMKIGERKWEAAFQETQGLSREDFTFIRKQVSKMHNDGILHLDLFGKNVLYQKDPETHRNTKFFITDFGHSIPFGQSLPVELRVYDWAMFLGGSYRSPVWFDIMKIDDWEDAIHQVCDELGGQESGRRLLENAIHEVVNNHGSIENPHFKPRNQNIRTNYLPMYRKIFEYLPQEYECFMSEQLPLIATWLYIPSQINPRLSQKEFVRMAWNHLKHCGDREYLRQTKITYENLLRLNGITE